MRRKKWHWKKRKNSEDSNHDSNNKTAMDDLKTNMGMRLFNSEKKTKSNDKKDNEPENEEKEKEEKEVNEENSGLNNKAEENDKKDTNNEFASNEDHILLDNMDSETPSTVGIECECGCSTWLEFLPNNNS